MRVAAAILLALAGLASIGASPPPRTYVADQLIVEFYRPPTETELEILEVKYKLALDQRAYGHAEVYLFRILDGLDAKLKQPFVAEDPLVCRVFLNWLGKLQATSSGPPSSEQPFGRCEGDEVRTPWTPPPWTPPPWTPPPPSAAAPASSPLPDPSPTPSGSRPTPETLPSMWLGAGVLGVLVAGVVVARWLLRRR